MRTHHRDKHTMFPECLMHHNAGILL